MRVVYFGSGEFGLPTFRRLAEAHEIVLVVTQPDRPAGRRRTLTPTSIGKLAASLGIPTLKPPYPNEPDIIRQVHAVKPEAFVVIAYGHKLGRELLGEHFAMNLHASLLPKYRGAAPINWAVINGEKQTGLTIITLAQKMDAGAILSSRVTAIDAMETAGELHDRLAEMGPDLVLETLSRHARGMLQPIRQDESSATRAPKLTKTDGTVRFDQPSHAVRCRVHGLTPWPGCTVQLAEQPLKLLRVDVVGEDREEYPTGMPGEILADRSVACEEGAIRLLSVQPPGGKAMSFDAYCNGHAVKAGARLRELRPSPRE